MSSDLASIGLRYDRWQDAVEAAMTTDSLSVIGEVDGGQLVQYADPAGSLITILAVEPFATFAGFASETVAFANVSMVTEVVALCEITDLFGNKVTSITANLAQGPLLVDEPQRWEQLGFAALATDYEIFANADLFSAAHPGEELTSYTSPGADAISRGDGSIVPDAEARFTARILSAEYRTAALTGQPFVHLTVDGAFAFDVLLPDRAELPEKNSIITGTAVMSATVLSPLAGEGGCGCGGSCGCGGH